ncbi:uncharacterized protein BX663DRAFT_519225 [Cokeromyces recurvatus]|uniref:uncharacterized protein n=1 Tax=Cokeromyces recurvatus TaxID=90255 RepID=UPI00221EE9E9|nr:uncharacterized protein BX663DRAFT_519225 [Cokeromyces recurvatus]KAI7899987.1 hypothetical protein BX663DRAFT_519225 [Cokeromyces recurvatus]
MTEPKTTSENKSSVVDDFFSALFANKGSGQGTSSYETTSTSTTTTNTTPSSLTSENKNGPDENNSEEQQTNSPINETASETKVLDEFDEYSLLSSRRRSEQANPSRRSSSHSRYPGGDAPAQILSKRDIDWSTVSPESRMLVRQLPKFVDKQEIMDYFSKYGEVIEVVQKNSFGFVHFENPEICARAVKAENGKIFNGVILDLEICKKKPYFARVLEEQAMASRRETSPPHMRDFSNPNNKRNSRSRSPPPRRKRRNSNSRTMIPSRNSGPMNNNQRNRQVQQWEYNDNYGRRNNVRRDTRFGELAYNPTQLLPTRNSHEVPTVQIISWSENFRNFMNYVESVFAQYHIRTSSAILHYSQSSKDEIVKQMVLEGVKAIIIIDRFNESKRKVYLQVFSANNQGGGVRYDEYDSVTPNEAVTIIQRSHPQIQPQVYNNTPSYIPQQQYQQPYTQQYQQPYPLQQQQYVPPQQQQQQQQPLNLDLNTLSTIYNMIQAKNTIPVPPTSAYNSTTTTQVAPTTTTPTPTPQPSVQQLLATLVSGLNMNNNMNTAPTTNQVSTPPVQQQQQQTNKINEQQPSPSMAALLSTAANGNPTLAQLLYQMTSNTTAATSSTAQVNKSTTNNSSATQQQSPSITQQQQQLSFGSFTRS